MSADVLRRAAALMRERAEAATPGPWTTVPGAVNVWHFPESGTPIAVAHGLTVRGMKLGQSDAKHIAGMHPAVALAVAVWLDEVAHTWELVAAANEDGYSLDWDGYPIKFEETTDSHALTVARSYLGESA